LDKGERRGTFLVTILCVPVHILMFLWRVHPPSGRLKNEQDHPQQVLFRRPFSLISRTRSCQFLGDADQFPHHARSEARLQVVGCSQVYGTSEDLFEMIL